MTRLALVGCGYVADFYLRTLPGHPQLELLGVADRDPGRARRVAAFYGSRVYESVERASDPRVDVVVNLTNPGSHYAVTHQALVAGKHVYSEKPLAASWDETQALCALAEQRGLQLAVAPCSVLGESAQTLWRALRQRRIGRPRLVYAELDDGPIHLRDFERWKSASGAPWPFKDEFEVGCTLEHAAYYVSWLVAFFGPARALTSFGALCAPDKGVLLERVAPDFSVACIEFADGLVARLTCSTFATPNHGLRIFGDEGVLSLADCWDYGSPVFLQKRTRLALRLNAETYPRAARLVGLGPKRLPLVRRPRGLLRGRGANPMDFARGIADLAAALEQGSRCRLSARFAQHVTEILLAIQTPGPAQGSRALSSTCDAMLPMPWADL